MRVKDLTYRNGLNHNDFVQFLKDNKLEYETGITGYVIPDRLAEEYKAKYLKYCEKRKKNIIADRQRLLMTTASYLDQYTVKDYYGLVTGHSAFHTGYWGKTTTQFIGTAGDARAADYEHVYNSYKKAESQALQEMQKEAQALGANAILAIQQNTTDAGGVVCFTVRGTAALIARKTEEQAQNNSNATDSPSSHTGSSSGSSTLSPMRPRDDMHETNPYVDPALCIGCEQCVDICPELFCMENNVATVLCDMTVETWIKGNEAISNCPVGAIKET